jgi:dUTP pyrophosphatase
MLIKVKKYNENAVIPVKAYDKDFCYDLVAVSEEEIAPNVWKYGFGIGLQIERSMETITKSVHPYSGFPDFALDFNRSPLNLSIDIRPRSSVWETGMVLSNCEGTVDEGYTNEISAVFYHVMPNMPRFKVGDKIAQMKIGFTFPCDFKVVDELADTERGLKGYGSSGK